MAPETTPKGKGTTITLTEEQVKALSGGKIMTADEIAGLLSTVAKKRDERKVRNRCKARAMLALIKANKPTFKQLLHAEYKKEGVAFKADS